MSFKLRTMLVAAGLLSAAVPAAGTTWLVAQDGTGDFTTLGAAVAAAANGDSILVRPGSYSEAVLIGKSLAIVSTDGPEVTVLDGGGYLRMIEYTYGGGGMLSGFRLEHGFGSVGGGAILAKNSGLITVDNCRFTSNVSDYQGGAVSIGEATPMAFGDCDFVNNYAPTHGGAMVVIQSSSLILERCRFIENGTGVFSGGVEANSSHIEVLDCIFLRNETGDVSGCIYTYFANGQIAGNTFEANVSPGRASVVLQGGSAVLVERNIFAGDTMGYGLQYHDAGGSHTCNLYWDNAAGAISGATLGPDELIADPLYCNPAEDHYELYDISPAAPAHSPCGQLIGALPVACSSTGIETNSFSAIKALY